ncbi:hypothetical protein T492DRAFT_843797 [Pavlovales sp. CCMP2436]|nr:hypothetical protein T492DRAFT_843797 [Pavlovales sp. CCMP2436]
MYYALADADHDVSTGLFALQAAVKQNTAMRRWARVLLSAQSIALEETARLFEIAKSELLAARKSAVRHALVVSGFRARAVGSEGAELPDYSEHASADNNSPGGLDVAGAAAVAAAAASEAEAAMAATALLPAELAALVRDGLLKADEFYIHICYAELAALVRDGLLKYLGLRGHAASTILCHAHPALTVSDLSELGSELAPATDWRLPTTIPTTIPTPSPKIPISASAESYPEASARTLRPGELSLALRARLCAELGLLPSAGLRTSADKSSGEGAATQFSAHAETGGKSSGESGGTLFDPVAFVRLAANALVEPSRTDFLHAVADDARAASDEANKAAAFALASGSWPPAPLPFSPGLSLHSARLFAVDWQALRLRPRPAAAVTAGDMTAAAAIAAKQASPPLLLRPRVLLERVAAAGLLDSRVILIGAAGAESFLIGAAEAEVNARSLALAWRLLRHDGGAADGDGEGGHLVRTAPIKFLLTTVEVARGSLGGNKAVGNTGRGGVGTVAVSALGGLDVFVTPGVSSVGAAVGDSSEGVHEFVAGSAGPGGDAQERMTRAAFAAAAEMEGGEAVSAEQLGALLRAAVTFGHADLPELDALLRKTSGNELRLKVHASVGLSVQSKPQFVGVALAVRSTRQLVFAML